VSFEEQNLENKFKVSVVYISEGQTTAAEMLSNIGSSLEFQKFLQLLGEHVKLQDFRGFAGDLDTVEGLTGKTSVYTTWRGLEIMYHVVSS
jgi:RAP1 GTPase activating protein 1